MPCEEIGKRMVSGEPLSPEQEAHVGTCGRCSEARALVVALEVAPPPEFSCGPVPVPSVATLRRASARRRIARGTAVALLVAAAVAIFPLAVGPRGVAPVGGESREIDLFAALDQVEEATRGSEGDALPGTEALALLDPYAESWSDPTLLIEDALSGEGGP